MSYIIKDLIIYPVKGMRGISVSQAVVMDEGLQNDRRYMVVDSQGKFISQRCHPVMAKFDVQLIDSCLLFCYEGETHHVQRDRDYQDEPVTVWDNDFHAQQVSKAANQWLSSKLGQELRLMFLGEQTDRVKVIPKLSTQTAVSFADGYPYLILGTASMALLNSKLKDPISHDRFRANILVDTKIAHEEDSWSIVDVGSTRFQVVKPCVRCQVINIDQQSGERYKEPIKTLSTYRAVDNKIRFAANAIALHDGVIKVGDTISLS